MKIRQIGEYTGDIISTVLRNRGIEDVATFLNPTISNYKTDVEQINNMMKGVETFLEFIRINARIGLVVDSDVDGITSASMLYNFIQDFTGGYENLFYYMHSDKTHGLTKEILEGIYKDNIEFVIIADASTNDVKQVEELYQRGIEVLIIDHHLAEEGYQENRAILINNQLDETNKQFVGAGMVMNFLRVVAQRTNRPIASKLMDLCALGQIADQSDISNAEIRGIVFYGLQNMHNPFLLHFMEQKEIKRGQCTPKDINYSVAPLINAVIRVGEMEEKEIIFRAFAGINPNEVFFVDKKKKNPATGKFDKIVVQMNLYEYAYDITVRLKGKQDRLVKKEVTYLQENAIVEGGIGIGFISEEAHGLTGLIAGRMANEFKVPFLVCRDCGDLYKGSGRGYDKVLKDFKQWCTDTKQFKLVQGHGNAFGFEIKKENLPFIIEESKKIEVETVHEVDLIVDGKIDHSLVPTLDKYKEIFGGKVKEPKFAFVNISVNKKLISHKGTTLSFYEDRFKFVKFGEEFNMDYLDSFRGDRVIVDFVGKIGFNEWNGQKTPQMIVTDYVIKEEPPKEITVENIVF